MLIALNSFISASLFSSAGLFLEQYPAKKIPKQRLVFSPCSELMMVNFLSSKIASESKFSISFLFVKN
jgi:hypothetical protein